MKIKYSILFLIMLLIGRSVKAQFLTNIEFINDWEAGQYDINNNWMGGTETIQIVAHKGQLFATIGYWTDVSGSDPESGPHILTKTSFDSEWKVDVSFEKFVPGTSVVQHVRAVALESLIFTKDTMGNLLPQPDTLLVASIDDALNLNIYTRDDITDQYNEAILFQGSAGNWNGDNYVRSMTPYEDPVTGGQFLLAGTTKKQIYKGWYDTSEPSKLKFNQSPEFVFPGFKVKSMCVANDKVYAGCGPNSTEVGGLWERSTTFPYSWELVYETLYSPSPPPYSNIRGITAVPDPATGDHEVILMNYEASGDIIRIDPTNNYAATIEVNVPLFIENFSDYPYMSVSPLAAYNKFVEYISPITGDTSHVFGLLAVRKTASGNINTTAPNNGTYFMIRHDSSSYSAFYVYDSLNPVESGKNLRSVRTICVSPFPEDQGNTIYLGGYDGAGVPNHNTAWIYKGIIQEAVSIEDNNMRNSLIKVYPNPFSKSTIIEFENPNNQDYTLTLYNINGKIIKEMTNILNNKVEVKRDNMPDGVYFFQVKSSRQIRAFGKLIIK